jgi:hypothetical protein
VVPCVIIGPVSLTDPGNQIQGEQVKIEKYLLGLQTDILDISMTLGRVFEIGVSHTKGDLATDWSPYSQFLAPVLAGKHVWLNAQNSTEISERLRQFHSAYSSSPIDTSACVLIMQSAPVDLHLLKNFVEVLTVLKGSPVRRLSDDGE